MIGMSGWFQRCRQARKNAKACWVVLAVLATTPVATGATISMIVTGVVTGEWRAGPGFSAVAAGDAFELVVSYTDSLPDQSMGYNPGRIYPGDLAVSLRIAGQGTVFAGVGGVVGTMIQCTSGPGGACYRAIQIVSGAAGGLVFELLIADKDGPSYPAGTGWIDYGVIEEYESVEFFIRQPFPDSLVSGGQLTGVASSLVIPEPCSVVLAVSGLGMVWCVRRRVRGGVDRDGGGN